MAQQYTNFNSVCATCEYWGGNRTFFDRSMQRIIVESSTVKARCYCKDSGWFSDSSGRQACFRCSKYERWSLMKQ